MNLGDFFEIVLLTLVFILDLISLRWMQEEGQYTAPPMMRRYVYYRQKSFGRIFRYLP